MRAHLGKATSIGHWRRAHPFLLPRELMRFWMARKRNRKQSDAAQASALEPARDRCDSFRAAWHYRSDPYRQVACASPTHPMLQPLAAPTDLRPLVRKKRAAIAVRVRLLFPECDLSTRAAHNFPARIAMLWPAPFRRLRRESSLEDRAHPRRIRCEWLAGILRRRCSTRSVFCPPAL